MGLEDWTEQQQQGSVSQVRVHRPRQAEPPHQRGSHLSMPTRNRSPHTPHLKTDGSQYSSGMHSSGEAARMSVTDLGYSRASNTGRTQRVST